MRNLTAITKLAWRCIFNLFFKFFYFHLQQLLSLCFANLYLRFYMTIQYIFLMKQEHHSPLCHQVSSQLPSQSDDSDEFQQLQEGFNQSVSRKRPNDSPLIKNKDRSSKKLIKQIKQQQFLERIKDLQIKLGQNQKQLEKQRTKNIQLNGLYQNSLKQITNLEQKLGKINADNKKTVEDNEILNEAYETVKQQNMQYIDKISCLQKRSQLQKEDLDSKFSIIKKSLQRYTKISIKSIDYQATFKLLINKLNEIEKLYEKVCQIQQMVIQKNPKPKTSPENSDLIEDKIKALQKVQNIMIKQQNRINSLRDYIAKLQQEINGSQKSHQTGIGKWLDPVIKFCKIEEGKQKEVRKKKQNN